MYPRLHPDVRSFQDKKSLRRDREVEVAQHLTPAKGASPAPCSVM